MRGTDLAAKARARGYRGTIVVATASREQADLVAAIMNGADEILAKPVKDGDLDLLIAKTKARARRDLPAVEFLRSVLEPIGQGVVFSMRNVFVLCEQAGPRDSRCRRRPRGAGGPRSGKTRRAGCEGAGRIRGVVFLDVSKPTAPGRGASSVSRPTRSRRGARARVPRAHARFFRVAQARRVPFAVLDLPVAPHADAPDLRAERRPDPQRERRDARRRRTRRSSTSGAATSRSLSARSTGFRRCSWSSPARSTPTGR